MPLPPVTVVVVVVLAPIKVFNSVKERPVWSARSLTVNPLASSASSTAAVPAAPPPASSKTFVALPKATFWSAITLSAATLSAATFWSAITLSAAALSAATFWSAITLSAATLSAAALAAVFPSIIVVAKFPSTVNPPKVVSPSISMSLLFLVVSGCFCVC